MDLTAAVSTSTTTSTTMSAVQTVMLKKAMDTESSAVLQLLNGLPQKDGLGQLIDVQM